MKVFRSVGSRAGLLTLGLALASGGCSDQTGPGEEPGYLGVAKLVASGGELRPLTCAIAGLHAYCWGSGAHGLPGAAPERPGPRIEVDVPLYDISTSGDHTCALGVGQVAYCWGGGSTGALGDGSFLDRNTPVLVEGRHLFQAISTGGGTTCAIDEEEAAFCWGHGASGKLGVGEDASGSNVPLPVAGGHRFRAISVGAAHACGIDIEGRPFCWGDGTHGQLGTGDARVVGLEPVPVARMDPGLAGDRLAVIEAGTRHTCGLRSGGQLHCWGDGSSGEFGTSAGSSSSPVAHPQRFSGLGVGDSFTCVLEFDSRRALCSGAGRDGRLGNGDVEGRSSFTPVTGGLRFLQLAVGERHACGLRADGDVWCWGNGRLEPERVPGFGPGSP